MKVISRSGLYRRMAALTFVVMGSAAFVACGGFSTEEAEARCDQEEAARAGGGCFTDVTYDSCVAAYEECGEDVDANDSCPLEYVCPAD